MTAHAMIGDRERCLAAGMDAYLTKPLRRQLLFEVLEGLPTSAANEHDPGPVVFDRPAALDRMAGDEGLLKELADIFFAECPQLLADLEIGLRTADADKVRLAAHTLKGSAANLGARAAAATAQRLEDMGRENRLADGPATLKLLHQQLKLLSEALHRDYHDGS